MLRGSIGKQSHEAPKLPSLAGLRAFEVAGRHGSFSKAADELGVTQGAVSKLIRQLESELGVALFARLARAVELTEHGKTYFQAIRVSFESMESATRALMDAGHSDVLQVSCLPTLASPWFMPRLASFTQKHRNVEVRLSTSIAPADFQRGELDVAICVGRKEPVPTGDRVIGGLLWLRACRGRRALPGSCAITLGSRRSSRRAGSDRTAPCRGKRQ